MNCCFLLSACVSVASRPCCAAWQRVDDLIATKKPREYDTAVQLLVDLRDLAEGDGDSTSFRHRLAELRAVHARKPSLLERLTLADLDT